MCIYMQYITDHKHIQNIIIIITFYLSKDKQKVHTRFFAV